jgi:hypothetical protein
MLLVFLWCALSFFLILIIYIFLIIVFLLHSVLETLHLLFHFFFLPLFTYSAFILLLFYHNFSYSSTYCHSSSIYSVPCPVALHICTDKINIYIKKIQQDATVCRYLFTAKLLYMFRMSIAPIIRST